VFVQKPLVIDRKKSFPPIVFVLIAVFIWSTGGLFIKLTSLDAYQVTFFRSSLAAITVLIVTRKNGLSINVFGIIASIIYAILLFLFVWATKHGTAANAIFLQYTAPIYILILAPFLISEKFHFKDLITVAFCIGGMSLFFIGKLDVTAYQANLAALGSGIFLGLYIMLLRHPRVVGSRQKAEGSEGILPVSAVDPQPNSPPYEGGVAAALADGVVLCERPDQQYEILRTRSLNPVVTVIYGNFLLALVTIPSGISALPRMTSLDWFAVSFLGIVQIGVAYILFIKGVTGGTRPLDASIIGFIEPLLNPFWVFLIVGEQPSTWALLGGAIIIATVAAHTLTQYRGQYRKA
jgi:DME family drug/metabolite transporter